MKHIFFLFGLQILLFSCQNKKADHEKAKQFVTIINDNTSGEIKAVQQECVNKMTEALRSLKENDNAKIDTRQLRELLDRAKKANHLTFSAIIKTQEVDDEINLKQKALDETELFRSLYENELPKLLEAFESNGHNKFAKLTESANLLASREQEIRKIQSAYKEAGDEFINKYDINFTKDSTK